MFTGVNVGIALANAAGYIVAVNPAFEHLLGYTQDEFLKMTIGDVTQLLQDKLSEVVGTPGLGHLND